MPNCDFYATEADHESLLRWMFVEKTCEVYESHSQYEQELKRYETADAVLADLSALPRAWRDRTLRLQVWVIDSGPPLTPRRISLNPKACNGATFRYAANGLGLVQLHLSLPVGDKLGNSHTNHFTEKGARVDWPLFQELAPASSWDFRRVTSFSARLNRQIRKLAVAKIRSRPVLPGALELWERGTSLSPWNPIDHADRLQRP